MAHIYVIVNSIIVSNVWTRSGFYSVTCGIIGHTVAKMEQCNFFTTTNNCITKTPSARCVVSNDPGRTDLSLGNSLLYETGNLQCFPGL